MAKCPEYLILFTCILLFAPAVGWFDDPALAAQEGGAAQAQYETRKLADNVYLFRYGGSQAMFVVTPDGVIAMDPISPEASKVYPGVALP